MSDADAMDAVPNEQLAAAHEKTWFEKNEALYLDCARRMHDLAAAINRGERPTVIFSYRDKEGGYIMHLAEKPAYDSFLDALLRVNQVYRDDETRQLIDPTAVAKSW